MKSLTQFCSLSTATLLSLIGLYGAFPTAALAQSQRSTWEANMLNYGAISYQTLQALRNQCGAVNPNTPCWDQQLANVNYDGAHVFAQIAAYTQDPTWHQAADLANEVYQTYVLDSQGKVPGFWNFSEGLEQRYLRTKDESARRAVAALATSALFTQFKTNDLEPDAAKPGSPTSRWIYSREVAYGIKTLLSAKRLGLFNEPDAYFSFLIGNGILEASDQNIGQELENRLSELVEFAFNHLNQWFSDESDPALYVKPFMVGLTANALIEYDQVVGDPRVFQVLARALPELWFEAWDAQAQAFKYIDRIPTNLSEVDPPCNDPAQISTSGCQELFQAAPDLNLLVSPAYQWMSFQLQAKGRPRAAQYFQNAADQIFNSGVQNAYLGEPNNFFAKQFNQNYFWSFDQILWRN